MGADVMAVRMLTYINTFLLSFSSSTASCDQIKKRCQYNGLQSSLIVAWTVHLSRTFGALCISGLALQILLVKKPSNNFGWYCSFSHQSIRRPRKLFELSVKKLYMHCYRSWNAFWVVIHCLMRNSQIIEHEKLRPTSLLVLIVFKGIQ